MLRPLLFALLLTTAVGCSHDAEAVFPIDYISRLQIGATPLGSLAESYPEVGWDTLTNDATLHPWAGRSVAVFGGSLASNSESDIVKEMWAEAMNLSSVTTYGTGGLGYATDGRSVQDFIPLLEPHDVYILWCSPNDYLTGVPVASQSVGLRRVISAARTINPNALVVGLASLPFFGEDAQREDGYLSNPTSDNGQGITFAAYVQAQLDVFAQEDVPCLNQWSMGLFSTRNWSTFYFPDGYHLRPAGYFLLGREHLRFFSSIE